MGLRRTGTKTISAGRFLRLKNMNCRRARLPLSQPVKTAFVTTCREAAPRLVDGNNAVLSDEGFTTGRLIAAKRR